ncbi:Type IV secretory pathway%2C VirD4 components [Bordetella pseudohinzii]|nr:Type IV secretory pathway%2C VirD4 components [Bordetella pseudohinzii]
MSFDGQKFRMPLRMPKDIGGLDHTDFVEERIVERAFWGLMRRSKIMRKVLPAAGMLYLGYLRTPDLSEVGRELWLTNSDCRTHAFVAGTTGSGKTETLLGMVDNAMTWCSAVLYGDGKASLALPFSIWGLARRHGQEDNFQLLNFLTGGIDPFEVERLQKELIVKNIVMLWQSNSFNPFGSSPFDFLLQLLVSMLVKAEGNGAEWRDKAINMIDAVLRILAFKRAQGELEISVQVIRDALALPNLVKFYLEGQQGLLPELAYLPIKAYFETGLPGFVPALAHDPTQWNEEVYNQHGYLTGQFTRVLSLLTDQYGYIFQDKYPEIDVNDTLMNNRILVVLIPSLSKSPEEAAAVGKLYASAIRLSMGMNLGYQLEGKKAEVLEKRGSVGRYPKLLINDELAYWFAVGMAVMFAQARELNCMMVAAVQDVQGLKRGEAKDESASLIANTKVKWCLALEDADDTFELIRKSGGQGYYSVLAGYNESSGMLLSSYEAQGAANIQEKDRVTLKELKKLQQGEGLVIFKDSVVPAASYYIPNEFKQSEVLAPRINRLLQIERPKFTRLAAAGAKPSANNARHASETVARLLASDRRPSYPDLDDPILAAVSQVAGRLSASTDLAVTAIERGIVLYEAALQAMREAQRNGTSPFFHRPVEPESPELMAAVDYNKLDEYPEED